MKRILIMLIFVAVLSPAFAEDKQGLRIDAGAGLYGSIYSTYISVNPELLYDFGFFAVGGGLNALYGLSFSDFYAAPYAEIELGIFYIDGGIVLPLNEPNPEAVSNGYITPESGTSPLPYVMIGLAGPIIPIGAGHIGIDLSLGIIPTASPVIAVDSSDNIFANIIGTIFISMFSAAADSIKAGASIYYTVTF
ncbi:MAG: hypothetical protein JEZ04_19665 [Spirochaetales bacterium]|nr:hypothetical protein [Spirochaetales bacterium]